MRASDIYSTTYAGQVVPSDGGLMPWTPREKRFLLSSDSPLSDEQKDKMKAELHENPALGHARKGQIHKGQSKIQNVRTHPGKLRHE